MRYIFVVLNLSWLPLSELFSLKDLFNREWSETETCSLVELVLELNPMEPECVKESFHEVHHHQYSDSEGDECEEPEE